MVVGEARTGEEAIRAVKRFAPQVVVMDVTCRECPGRGHPRGGRVLARHPRTRLTISGDHDDVLSAISAGACGYLLKDSSLDELVEGIRTAASGGSMLSPRTVAPLLRELKAHADVSAMDNALSTELSEREVAVLKLLVQGAENAEIAGALFISTSTVKHHISAIIEKLNVENRVQAAVYAVRIGLV